MQRQATNDSPPIRVLNAVAAGTTDQNSAGVDMRGFDAVRFIAMFGTLTATQVTSIKAQQSDDDSTYEDIAGSSVGPLADGDGNKCLSLDIFRPQKRYVRLVVDRGTANAVIDGVLAFPYIAHRTPQVPGSTVAAYKVLNNPAAGTA